MNKKIDLNLYRQIVENSGEGIWILDKNNHTFYVNEAMASMLGCTREELAEANLFHFVSPLDCLEAEKLMEERKKGIIVKHLEWRFLRKDKTTLWTLVTANPLYDEDGNYFGAVGQFRDITQKKKNDTVLIAQRNVFDSLIGGKTLEMALNELLRPIEVLEGNVYASILLLDEEEKIIKSGTSPSLPVSFINSLIGQQIGPCAGSCGTAAFKKETVIVSDIETDRLWHNYKSLAHPYGLKACWSSPIFSREDKVLGTFAMYFKENRNPNEFDQSIVKDVTTAASLAIEYTKLLHNLDTLLKRERKHTRDASLLAEAGKILSRSIEYTDVLKSIPELIVSHFADWCFISLTDEDGNLKPLTAAASPQKMVFLKEFEKYKSDSRAPHGLPRALREGKALLYSHLVDDDFDLTKHEWPKIGTQDSKFVEFVKKQGLKSYLAIPLIVRGQTLGGMIIASVQEGRQYTEEDLNLMDEIGRRCATAIDNSLLYQDSKRAIQNREDFIAVASHELRTPLTSLQMRVDVLNRQLEKNKFPPELEAKLRPLVSGIKPDIKKFTTLIKTLLDVTKFRTNNLSLQSEKVDISRVLLDEIDRMKLLFLHEGCPLEVKIQQGVIGVIDSIRIQEVIINLLSNALKFGEKKTVTISMKATESKILITVKDQGMGVGFEDKSRVFKPFERAVSDKNFGGLGLGLYISQQIIEAHGGQITVESSKEQGTIFTVELPRRMN